ncbi:helix-turn-helix domain-containing protein [Ulvibacterium marinum]|uniref:Uncharacterized protein n=1 Tax=Ulvibacterium marinum TaxID=2419782 RepID=A0A3B0CAI2_9FLAO|nr:hypothetical protein [Ulvibacterium marinum]RKN83505.1 hypothetical protein D7Z94_06720 [Ulvibacterium marinum]
MKNIEELQNATIKDFTFIGKRLKKIRLELKKNDDAKDKRFSRFSAKNVAESLGVDYNSLINIERGTISVLTMKAVLFYHSLGYNPMWVLLPDNEFIPKQNIGDNLVYQSDVQDSYKEMEHAVVAALTEFKAKI